MLKNKVYSHFCDVCFVGVLFDHPDEEQYLLGWLKCPICAYCKCVEQEINPLHKIVFGKEDVTK